jgi:hypothetical protein
MPMPLNSPARFWSHVRKTDGCWLWLGNQGRRVLPYGLVTWHGRRVYCHRKVWELTYGPIPNGMQVLHSCDVPYCVRPDHLFLGTQQVNVDDCVKKGRRGTRGRPNSVVRLEQSRG